MNINRGLSSGEGYYKDTCSTHLEPFPFLGMRDEIKVTTELCTRTDLGDHNNKRT